jgi:hypothetical protein
MALEEYIKQVKETWTNYTLDLVNYQNKCRLIRYACISLLPSSNRLRVSSQWLGRPVQQVQRESELFSCYETVSLLQRSFPRCFLVCFSCAETPL